MDIAHYEELVFFPQTSRPPKFSPLEAILRSIDLPFISFLDIIAEICQDNALDNFEIFSLQSIAGSIHWLNGRNRIDLQLSSLSGTNVGQFYFRIKYFPDISILKMSTKRFLLWQVYDDYIKERNGYDTIQSHFFNDFKQAITANYKANELLAVIVQQPQYGSYTIPITEPDEKLTESIAVSVVLGQKLLIIGREGLTFPGKYEALERYCKNIVCIH